MASSYLQRYPVPDGFPELLHDLIKAILREQPSDIVEYCHEFFKNISEGKDEPVVQKKNYYGDQMDSQQQAGYSNVIPNNGSNDKSVGGGYSNRQPSGNSKEKSYKSSYTKKSGSTNKEISHQYVHEQNDQAINAYESQMDDDEN